MPDLSIAVVIVSYNVREELARCLESIAQGSAPFPTSITIVDNGSTDGTEDMVRSEWPAVQLIAAGENLGFSRGNNVGIHASAGELVLLLNPDTIVPPGAIETLVRTLVAHPEAAAVGPRLVDAEGVAELSFGWTISLLGELKQKLVGGLHDRGVRPIVRWVERWTREAGEREWLTGACLLVRRADLEAVGLLDERYFMYTEDVDLCVSLRQRGRSLLFVPDAQVVHLRGRSAGRNPHTERLRRQSQLAYYEKHHPRWSWGLKLYLRWRQ